ncbi:MFS transporter [Actinospica durhamensis]|uniref:MFS transporter n=1 Tax=Actinospica durhamensis TaxID=1508375 RepID=A0A941ESK6_9ACTN|nr:MFS transporter [Actinospica durhamensis]MBR7835713.1 MFS transporter [Actinospica durhamensis]
MILGSTLASIDATVVGIALPAIGRDFGATVSGLQWVVTAYTLTLGGLLLVGGALGDRHGRKRYFVIGVIWFALASGLCGLAPNTAVLIVARSIQGVGAALLMPGSLAILEASFVPEDRGKAIGIWSGFTGVGGAIGPLLGGVLIEWASWRLIFAINLPLAAAVVVLALRHVPESRDPSLSGTRLDVTGGALVTLGLAGLAYGLIEGPSGGWHGVAAVAALVSGVLLLTVFVLWERHAATPMLPLKLFRSRQFSATNAVTFVLYGAIGGVFFLLPVQLQEVSGYSPLEAGLALLPLTALTFTLSARSGALAARIGPRLQMSAGPCIVGLGVLLLVRIDATGTYWTQVLPSVLLLGLGFATTVAPLTSTALSSAPSTQSGVASAVNNDVARTAGLIAVAVLPAVAGITERAYLDPAAFSRGFHKASVVSGLLCVLSGLMAAVLIRNPHPLTAPQPPEGEFLRHCPLDAPPPRVNV